MMDFLQNFFSAISALSLYILSKIFPMSNMMLPQHLFLTSVAGRCREHGRLTPANGGPLRHVMNVEKKNSGGDDDSDYGLGYGPGRTALPPHR